MSDGFPPSDNNPADQPTAAQFPTEQPPQQGFPQPGVPQQGLPPQGAPQQGFPQPGAPQQGFPPQGAQGQFGGGPPVENKKMLAGILGIVLGGFGAHKFALGYTTEALIQLAATIFTCGLAAPIGLIEGIIYLTKSDEEFYHTYQVNKKGWF